MEKIKACCTYCKNNPREVVAIGGFIDMIVSALFLIYTYSTLSFDSKFGKLMNINSLYRSNYNNEANESIILSTSSSREPISDFIHLSFNIKAVRTIFIPPATAIFITGGVIFTAGLLNKYIYTLISCIITSILIGGLIPYSIALLVIKLNYFFILPPATFLIFTHLFFLLLLMKIGEDGGVRRKREINESEYPIVYYDDEEDMGIEFKAKNGGEVPMIVISKPKPRLQTPAPYIEENETIKT